MLFEHRMWKECMEHIIRFSDEVFRGTWSAALRGPTLCVVPYIAGRHNGFQTSAERAGVVMPYPVDICISAGDLSPYRRMQIYAGGLCTVSRC